MRLIIVAAGQGYQLDGFNQILIKHPETGKRIIEQYLEIFDQKRITIVVGYRAINIMHRYPNLHYIYNDQWSVTNNSYSLGLALTDEPCYVVSSDLFFDKRIFEMLDDSEPNCVLTSNREDRVLSSLNCSVVDGVVKEVYQGPLKSTEDPEAVGVYKISDKSVLRKWKKECLLHSNLFNGQNLPLRLEALVHSVDVGEFDVNEVNTPLDYIALTEKAGVE